MWMRRGLGLFRKFRECNALDRIGKDVALKHAFFPSWIAIKQLHTTAIRPTGQTPSDIKDLTSGSATTDTSTNAPPSIGDRPKFPDPANAFENPLASLSVDILTDAKGRSGVPMWDGMKRGQEIKVYERKVDENGVAHAKGGRKTSSAFVKVFEGKGVITVNGRSWVDYFPSVAQRDKILRPMALLGVIGRFDLSCRVSGGGHTGQAEAIRFSLARALQNWYPQWRPMLKKEGLLTRDSRIVEPKKYGRKKARKSFQWVKR